MRTVAVKSADQQARAMLFRTREMLIGQRTQLANALRGHLAEHGHLVPQGLGNVARFAEIIASAENDLPDIVRDLARLYLDQIAS
jgi:transposase